MVRFGPTELIVDGTAWDDAPRDTIAHICVSHGESIKFIQFAYFENGNLAVGDKHGGDPGPKFNVVTFNYPSEFLTGMHGCYRYHDEMCNGLAHRVRVVSSITFSTNERTYGPFGCTNKSGDGPDFDYQLGRQNTFAGFHGTADRYLNSIGVHMKAVPTVVSNVNNPVEETKSGKVVYILKK